MKISLHLNGYRLRLNIHIELVEFSSKAFTQFFHSRQDLTQTARSISSHSHRTNTDFGFPSDRIGKPENWSCYIACRNTHTTDTSSTDSLTVSSLCTKTRKSATETHSGTNTPNSRRFCCSGYGKVSANLLIASMPSVQMQIGIRTVHPAAISLNAQRFHS